MKKGFFKKLITLGSVATVALSSLVGCNFGEITIERVQDSNGGVMSAYEVVSNLSSGEILSQSAELVEGGYQIMLVKEDSITQFEVDEDFDIVNIEEVSAENIVSSEENTESVPSVMDLAYKKALEIYDIDEDEINSFDVDIHKFMGVDVVDVDINTDDANYNYLFKADDLTVLEQSIKLNYTKPEDTTSYISEEDALEIALALVEGATEDSVLSLKEKAAKHKGVKVYKIEFECLGYKYEIKVRATDGKIVKFSKEVTKETIISSSLETSVTKEQAIQIAYEFIGISQEEAIVKKVKIDYEHKKFVYEIKIESQKGEYEIEVDVETGKIVDYDIEKKGKFNKGKDKVNEKPSKEPIVKYLTLEEAQNVVMKLLDDETAMCISIEVVKLGEDFCYELEVRQGKNGKGPKRQEVVKYVIDAQTGEVLSSVVEELLTDEYFQNAVGTITESQAIQIALEKFSVFEGEAKIKLCKLINKDGEKYFKVQFSVNDLHYSFKINAQTGEIIECDKQYK